MKSCAPRFGQLCDGGDAGKSRENFITDLGGGKGVGHRFCR